MNGFIPLHRALILLLVSGIIPTSHARDILIPAGSSQWAYQDDGTLTGTGWRQAAYDDAAWKAGTAPLGYGDGDEATVIGFGSDTAAKFITTCFRHDFNVADPAIYGTLRLRLQRDDGAVVYLNGAELLRDNMPAGLVGFDTLATAAAGGSAESTYQSFNLTCATLQPGRNLLAVEIHQSAPASSDVSMDLELSGEWLPLEIHPITPSEGATVHAASAQLMTTLTDPIAAPGGLSVTFRGRVAGPPAGPDFTLVAIPDTQYYTGNKNGGTPDMFIAQTEWILREQASRNIVFVTQLGDCVENGDNGGDPVEWLHATNALYRLETPWFPQMPEGMPYGFAPGNHDLSDIASGAPVSVFYNQFFGVNHFSGRSYYGGHHGTNNNNNYQVFSASGLDFIMVHLEYDTTPEAAVLEWANQLLRAHPSRRAIIVSHYLIESGDQAAFGAQGQRVYDALKDNPNLFMMLSGHVPGEGRRQDTWNNRTVHTLLADYQGRTSGGNGWLRLLEFSPSNQVVRVRTYSTHLNRYETDADSEFTLACDLRTGEPFRMLGQQTALNPDDQATQAWTQLEPGTSYEWYAEVTDGVRTQASPIRCFATQPAAVGVGNNESLTPVPVIQSLRVADGRVTLAWSSVADRRYRVCVKQDLSNPAWTDFSEVLTAAGPSTQWSHPMQGTVGRLFYAIRVVDPSEP